MLNLLCAIPENVGWMIVGAVGCICFQMWVKVMKCGIEMIKDRLTDDDDDEIEA